MRVRGIALTRRDEHDAERELPGGNRTRVGLAGGAAADVAVLSPPVALDPRVGEGVPVRLPVHEAGHAGFQELVERRHQEPSSSG